MSQINAKNLKENRITVEEAKSLNEKYDGIKPKSLDIFLEYVGLTEEEFNSFINPMVIPPHNANFKNNNIQ